MINARLIDIYIDGGTPGYTAEKEGHPLIYRSGTHDRPTFFPS